MSTLSPAVAFRWNILGDLVLEDDQAIVEIFWKAKVEFRHLDMSGQVSLARATLIQLLDDGLIEIYESTSGRPLHQEEAAGVLATNNWVDDPPPPAVLTLFARATDLGVAAVADPPDEVQMLWSRDRSKDES